MDLQVKIRQIVHEHSGGVKLVELITELAVEGYKAGDRGFSHDDVILCVDRDPTLNAYGYVWNMSPPGTDDNGVHREKVFVHQV